MKDMLSYQKEQIKNETILIRELKLKIKNDTKFDNESKDIEINYYKNICDFISLREQNSKRHYWYFMLKNFKRIKYQEIIFNRINHNNSLNLNEKECLEIIYNTLLKIK